VERWAVLPPLPQQLAATDPALRLFVHPHCLVVCLWGADAARKLTAGSATGKPVPYLRLDLTEEGLALVSVHLLLQGRIAKYKKLLPPQYAINNYTS